MRKKVTTTIQEGLWHRLQVQAVKQGADVNDILEVLIADYLKNPKRWNKETTKKGSE
jgi:hypothetical protein